MEVIWKKKRTVGSFDSKYSSIMVTIADNKGKYIIIIIHYYLHGLRQIDH